MRRVGIVLIVFYQALASTILLQFTNLAPINSLLFFGSGMAVSFLLLRLPELKLRLDPVKTTAIPFYSIQLLLFAIACIVGYSLSRTIMDNTPVDPQYADMIPIMMKMNERFVDGEWRQVYAPIPEIWNGVQPIYLPALWIPFVSSILLDFDPRWVTVAGLYLSFLLVLIPLRAKRAMNILLSIALIYSLYILFRWFHFEETNNVIRLTEEGVVYAYYGLLIYAVVSKRPILIGIAAALCLLSRYAMIGWIPCLGLYYILNKNYNHLMRASFSGISVFLLLLIIPFGWRPIEVLLELPAKYIDHAQLEWQRNPNYFLHSLGLAKFFGPNGVPALHTTLLVSSFAAPLVFLLVWGRRRGNNNVLLACLNMAIVFFYNFLDVTYLYLYYTPVFVTLIIAAFAAGQKNIIYNANAQ